MRTPEVIGRRGTGRAKHCDIVAEFVVKGAVSRAWSVFFFFIFGRLDLYYGKALVLKFAQ